MDIDNGMEKELLFPHPILSCQHERLLTSNMNRTLYTQPFGYHVSNHSRPELLASTSMSLMLPRRFPYAFYIASTSPHRQNTSSLKSCLTTHLPLQYHHIPFSHPSTMTISPARSYDLISIVFALTLLSISLNHQVALAQDSATDVILTSNPTYPTVSPDWVIDCDAFIKGVACPGNLGSPLPSANKTAQWQWIQAGNCEYGVYLAPALPSDILSQSCSPTLNDLYNSTFAPAMYYASNGPNRASININTKLPGDLGFPKNAMYTGCSLVADQPSWIMQYVPNAPR